MIAGGLIGLLITIIILGIVFYLAWWALSKIPLGEPFGPIAQAILALIALVVILSLLLGYVPVPAHLRY